MLNNWSSQNYFMDTGLVRRGSHAHENSYGLREYRLVVYPDISIYNMVMAERRKFFAEYGVEVEGKAFPYILVAAFHAGEGMEETLIRWIQRICSLQTSFTVSLNNYSGTPSGSIYLRVQNQQPFKHLSQQLRSLDHYIQLPSNAPRKTYQTAYLPIANNLPVSIYEKAMPVYSRKLFYASFHASELVLLTRDHPFAAHKTLTVFRFLPEGQLTGVA